jgi:hypothetical protein
VTAQRLGAPIVENAVHLVDSVLRPINEHFTHSAGAINTILPGSTGSIHVFSMVVVWSSYNLRRECRVQLHLFSEGFWI